MSKRVLSVSPGPVPGSHEFNATKRIQDGDIVTFKYPDGKSRQLIARGARHGQLCRDCPFRNQRPGGLILCGMYRVTDAGRKHRACELHAPYYANQIMLQWFDVDKLMEDL